MSAGPGITVSAQLGGGFLLFGPGGGPLMVPLRVFNGEEPSSASGVGGRAVAVGGVSDGVAVPGVPADVPALMAARIALNPAVVMPEGPGPRMCSRVG